MSDIVVPNNNFYYESEFSRDDIFFNSVYSTDITIEEYFSKMLFYSDLSRIVYASNEYCFRRRSEMNNGLLNIPFMNYYLSKITTDVSHQWWKHMNNVAPMLDLGGYKSLIGFGIKLVPIKLSYEATVWFSQDRDLQYAMSKILMSNTNETIIYSTLNTSSDYALKNLGLLTYNFDFKPQYTENDWLESNNITSIALDFEIDTFAVYPDSENILETPQPGAYPIYIANEVILNLLSTKGTLLKNENLLNTTPQELLTFYFTGTT